MQSSYSRRQAEKAISRASLGLFCLVLLLAPVTEARRPDRTARRRDRLGGPRRQNATFCAQEVAGCNLCFTETPAVADGAQFPGSEQPPKPETVVRCKRCRLAGYEYNKEQENCDCAAGYGTAFSNGTLIEVDFLVPPTYPNTTSDVFPLPEDMPGNTNSSGRNGKAAAGGATTQSFLEAGTSVTSSQRITGATAATRDTVRQMQPAMLKRFESNMRSRGYNVRTTRTGTFVSESPRVYTFASIESNTRQAEPATPVGEETAPEQPLICVSCKGRTVSVGGLIGGSYCMPCDAGMKPNVNRTECVPVQ